MNEPNRRETDAMTLLLLSKMDDLHLTLTDHADTIRSNRGDLDCVIRGQERLTVMITDHVEEENTTLETVKNFLAGLKGINALLEAVGRVGKAVGVFAIIGGAIVLLWDKVSHGISAFFTKGWP